MTFSVFLLNLFLKWTCIYNKNFDYVSYFCLFNMLSVFYSVDLKWKKKRKKNGTKKARVFFSFFSRKKNFIVSWNNSNIKTLIFFSDNNLKLESLSICKRKNALNIIVFLLSGADNVLCISLNTLIYLLTL
jgi:hypothetical protein